MTFVGKVVYFLTSFVFCFLYFFNSALGFLERAVHIFYSFSKLGSFLPDKFDIPIVLIFKPFYLMVFVLVVHNSTVGADRLFACLAIVS